MRLISLKMYNIGPYAKETEVPFDDLGNGLILFTGDTGAGKTMIFDAITYALFGKCSGEHRSEKSLVCNFSRIDKERPYVSLTFEHGGKQYLLLRKPEFKKEGNKNSTSAEANLSCEGHEVAKKPVEVNNFIKDMLGINDTQWKQIVMLPQGEFMELLNADSTKRSELLRKLFNTNRFRALQETLAGMYAESSENTAKSKVALDAAIDSLSIPDGVSVDRSDVGSLIEKIDAWCDEEDAKKDGYDNEKQALDKKYREAVNEYNDGIEVQKQRSNLDEKNRMMLVLNSEKPSMDGKRDLRDRASKSVDLNNRRHGYQSCVQEIGKCNDSKAGAESRLASLESEFAVIAEKVKTIPDMESEKDSLNLELEKLKESRGTLKRMRELQPIRENLMMRQDGIDKRIVMLNEESTNLKSEHQKLLDKISENSNIEPLMEASVSERRSIESEFLKLKDFISKADRLKEQKKEIDDKRRMLERYQDEYDKSRTKYNEADDLFIRSQAGLLAKDLSEGTPCPVCGNTHHISLASVVEGAPDEKTLKKLKKDMEEKHNLRNSVSNDIEKLNGTYDSELNHILEYTGGSCESIESDLDAKSNELNGKMDAVKARISSLDERKSILEADRKELSKVETGIRNIEESLKSVSDERESVSSDLNKLNEEWAVVSDRVTETDESVLSKKIDDANNRLNSITKDIDDIRRKEKDCNASMGEQRGIISDNNERLEKLNAMESELGTTYHRMLEASGMTEEELERLSEVDISKLTDEISRFDNEYIACSTSIEQLSASIEGKTDVPTDVLNDICTKAKTELDEFIKNVERSQERVRSNRTALKRIKDANSVYEENNSRSKLLEDLSKVANGTMSGTSRLPFEMYAQKTYFDTVLERANQRLGIMSNNRYHLEQSDEGGRSSKDAMDINVFDACSGKTRDVGSLSGGESFKAALSLALGLSDVVQSTSNGSRVEALFIDEGFGSLDADSLSQAVSVLEGLSDGDIPVCIISHIDTLKERISKKVIVKGKPGTGSSISIEKY